MWRHASELEKNIFYFVEYEAIKREKNYVKMWKRKVRVNLLHNGKKPFFVFFSIYNHLCGFPIWDLFIFTQHSNFFLLLISLVLFIRFPFPFSHSLSLSHRIAPMKSEEWWWQCPHEKWRSRAEYESLTHMNELASHFFPSHFKSKETNAKEKVKKT